MQRYTTVKSPRDSKKVGFLFGGLYVVSAVLWMLPPMLYRVYDPSLAGLDNENAYLLMCKLAMPAGLLGLMLGGMIFATASSLNGTLNISAGVFTNDIYKRLRPNASDRTLMRVARLSTLGFGVMAVIVALLVKSMGGIVNVVVSVAALTGVPIYLPVIWSLFSKRQNARSVVMVTLVSLAITLSFKFLTPVFGLTLSRSAEMMVGAFVPVTLLVITEIYFRLTHYVNPMGEAYASREVVIDHTPAATAESVAANRFTRRVLGLSIAVAGLFITVLGCLVESSQYVPVTMGLIVLAVGLFIRCKK